jgi:hypothetical protein
VQSQPELAIGADKKVFAMTSTRFKAAPFQSARQLWRCSLFQDVCIPHVHIVDALMQTSGVKIALGYFNLWQLWHCRLSDFLEKFF